MMEDLVVDTVDGGDKFGGIAFRGDDEINAHANIFNCARDFFAQLAQFSFSVIGEKDGKIQIA
jgi:hypothetical protein